MILVVGGAGYIGSHLVKELVEKVADRKAVIEYTNRRSLLIFTSNTEKISIMISKKHLLLTSKIKKR